MGTSKEEHVDEALFDPPKSVLDFYSEYGVSYDEWYPHKDQLIAYIKEKFSLANKQRRGVDDLNGLLPATVSPFNIYFTNKNLESVGRSYDSEFEINSSGLRCDEFSKDHDGLHVLFAGCSITFGDGMINEYIWPQKVYNRIASEQKVSGYYNVSIPGANNLDIYHQIFKYIELYGSPDVLFVNFPDLSRTLDVGVSLRALYRVIEPMHLALELLCDSMGITMVGFSWDRHVYSKGGKTHGDQSHASDDRLEGHADDPRSKWIKGFYRFSENDRLRHKMKFSQANEGHELAKYFFNAFDIVHPGIAEQDFYASFAYQAWIDSRS